MLAIAATENQQILSPSNSNHQFRSIHPRQIQSRHTHAGGLARHHPRQRHDSHRSRVWRPPLPSVLLAQTDPFLVSQHPIPDPNDFPTCQVVSVRAPAATDGRPAPSACCLAGSRAVTVPNAYQAHTQPIHLYDRPPPIGSV